MTMERMTPRSVRRRAGWALWLALLPIASSPQPAASPRPESAAALPDTPQILFKDLFVAVQTAHIYADGKAFPDAVPKAAPESILQQYHAERPDSQAALKRFVEAHFVMPAEVTGATSPPASVSIVALEMHSVGIEQLIAVLSSTALGTGCGR